MSAKSSQYRNKKKLLRLQRIRESEEVLDLGRRAISNLRNPSNAAGVGTTQIHYRTPLPLVQAESKTVGKHNQRSEDQPCSFSSKTAGMGLISNSTASLQDCSMLHFETSLSFATLGEENNQINMEEMNDNIEEEGRQCENVESNIEFLQDKPRDLALRITRIAAKHKLSDVCVTEIINLLHSCSASAAEGLPIKNVKQLDIALGLKNFNVKVLTTCVICKKIEEQHLFKNPFSKKCCNTFKSHNEPHYIILDLREILQVHLPCIHRNLNQYNLPHPYLLDLKNSVDFSTDDITLTLNTDGAPLFSSSNTSLWPVLAYVDGTSSRCKRSNVLILGLYIAKKGHKPDFKTLLQPIIEQINNLSNVPLKWSTESGQIIYTRVFLSNVCCDSIARPPVQGLMQFNARFGCGYCLHDQPNHYFSHRIIERKRSNSCHRRALSKGIPARRDEQGIISESPFLSLLYFDIIRGFPPDVMHTVYLGVTKLFTMKWLTEASKPYSLSDEQKIEVDKYLLAIKPPSRVSRTPRPIKYHSLYKAHEWSVGLFYYSPLILQSVLPTVYFKHWHLLVHGISLLVGETVLPNQIDESEKCLFDFSSQIEALYGFNSCRFNVHLLLHLPDFVRSHGPLQNYSMFAFENFNMQLTNYVTGSQGVGSQIAKRFLKDLLLKFHDRSLNSQRVPRKNWIKVGQYHVMNASSTSVITDEDMTYLSSLNVVVNVNEVCVYGRAEIIGRVIHSSIYNKVKLRNNCCVVINPTEVLEIKYFLVFKNEVHAYGSLHTITHAPCNVNYIYVSLNYTPCLIPLNKLNMIVFKIEFRNTVYFLEFLNETEWICD